MAYLKEHTMPQDGIVTPLGLADVKIAQMLTDPIGGTATYGSAYDIPGAQSISFKPDFLDKELRGDNKVLDQYSKVQSISGSAKHAKISLALMAIFMGGTISDSGSSPNEKRTLTVLGSDKPSYFSLEGQVDYRGGEAVGGDFHVRFAKVKITNFSCEFQSEDYAVVSFDWKAIPRSDDVLYVWEENETAVPLTEGTADTTPPTVSSVSPADAATGVAVGANVVWTMSEDLQAAGVNTGSVMVVKTSDGTNVPGVVTLANAGSSTTVTFNPDSNLTASTDYMAVLTTAVRDLAGNRLASPNVINFTTA